ncbi:LOW QUALITY PROTEIN: hypothetical protein HZS_2403 [Henneguya salminicola]|nr:LOW QUALITY PROTEIN: hypothetical protein HZS_2403 [Henneguya salminicola]
MLHVRYVKGKENLKSYFSQEEYTILYVNKKEKLTECPNCHNSTISRRKRRLGCTKKQWSMFNLIFF